MKGGMPVTVIYVDSVFILNSSMDYLLCLVTGRLAGIPLKRKRYLLASLLGGVYAVAVFLPGVGFLSHAPVKLAMGIIMALIAYGEEQQLFRLTLLFFAVSCGIAGCVLGLGMLTGSAIPQVNGIFYTDISGKVLFISAAAAYFVLTIVFRAAAKHGVHGELLPVRISIGGCVTAMTALWDTGNQLREPINGKQVLVVDIATLYGILPKGAVQILTEDTLQNPAEVLHLLMRAAPQLKPQLIPYHAVGTSSGLLLGIKTDWIEICGVRHSVMTAALSPVKLGNGYSALWGGEVRKEGEHEVFKADLAVAARTTGNNTDDSLYWRKRHAAAAFEQGARDRTAGAYRGGRGAQGTH